ncbi:hypothetical protein YB51_9105 [Streptococcus suis YB51]|nr:hypothetical protein YB51_9105 [Streptococcus suis YB51]
MNSQIIWNMAINILNSQTYILPIIDYFYPDKITLSGFFGIMEK